MKLLLEVSGSDEDEAIKLAINAAGKANDDLITRQIISHIMGEADGAVKVRCANLCFYRGIQCVSFSKKHFFLNY